MKKSDGRIEKRIGPAPNPHAEPRARGRSVYLTDELWAAAETRAQRDDRSISYVISAALRAYLKQ